VPSVRELHYLHEDDAAPGERLAARFRRRWQHRWQLRGPDALDTAPSEQALSERAMEVWLPHR
jgi:hypothetical protein